MFVDSRSICKRYFLPLLILFTLFGPRSVTSQGADSISVREDEIVRRAADEIKRYREEFRNLLALETKTFRIYDKSSELKKQRVIISNFLVYDLANEMGQTTEFRNVLSVDGKPIADGERRAVQMFEKVSRAETSAKELDRVQKESLRFDEQIKMYGLTLFQAIALNESIRDVIDFRLTGKEHLLGTEAYVLDYQQLKPSTFINAGSRTVGGGILDYEFDTNGIGPVDPRISGKLWVDSKTFQIVREERKLWVHAPQLNRPALLTSTEFDFEKSKYGIRTPKHISHTEYRVEKDRPGTKFIEIMYDYSSFTRPDVEVTPDKQKP